MAEQTTETPWWSVNLSTFMKRLYIVQFVAASFFIVDAALEGRWGYVGVFSFYLTLGVIGLLTRARREAR